MRPKTHQDRQTHQDPSGSSGPTIPYQDSPGLIRTHQEHIGNPSEPMNIFQTSFILLTSDEKLLNLISILALQLDPLSGDIKIPGCITSGLSFEIHCNIDLYLSVFTNDILIHVEKVNISFVSTGITRAPYFFPCCKLVVEPGHVVV